MGPRMGFWGVVLAVCSVLSWVQVAYADDGPRIKRVSTLAGALTAGAADGIATAARFKGPSGVAWVNMPDGRELAIVVDHRNAVVRSINIATAEVTTLAGTTGTVPSCCHQDGTGTEAVFYSPFGLGIKSDANSGTFAYVADLNANRIREINVDTGVTLTKFENPATSDVTNSLTEPSGVAADAAGNLYVADTGNNRIVKIDSEGVFSVLAGGSQGFQDGASASARFQRPTSVVISPDESSLFITDKQNNAVRMVSVSSGATTTVAGSGTAGCLDGAGVVATFNKPESLTIDSTGTRLIVADVDNQLLREVILDSNGVGTVSTFAGQCGTTNYTGDGLVPLQATFSHPSGLAFSPDGYIVLISDTNNNAIRAVASCADSDCDTGKYRSVCDARTRGECVFCSKSPQGVYTQPTSNKYGDACEWECNNGWWKISARNLQCLQCNNTKPPNSTYSSPGIDDQNNCEWSCGDGFRPRADGTGCEKIPESRCFESKEFSPGTGLCAGKPFSAKGCGPDQNSYDASVQRIVDTLDAILGQEQICRDWFTTGSDTAIAAIAQSLGLDTPSNESSLASQGLCPYFGGELRTDFSGSPEECGFLCDMRSLLVERFVGSCNDESDCPQGITGGRMPCCPDVTGLVQLSCNGFDGASVRETSLGQADGICNVVTGCGRLSAGLRLSPTLSRLSIILVGILFICISGIAP